MTQPGVSSGVPVGGDFLFDEGLKQLDRPADVVLGEAVTIDLRPASFATRALAYLLDLVVMGVIGLGLLLAVAMVSPYLDSALTDALILTTMVIALVVLPITWETLTRGHSPGKYAAGLRVVRDDGGPIRLRQATVRALLAVPEILLTSGSVALITSLANPKGKRIGDLLAGTYVVRERTERYLERPPLMPPRLAGWAVTADMARIPDALALAARQLLTRAPMMNPEVRQRLTVQLADQLAGYVAPSPPGVVAPEEFLAAVLAERHRREVIRLERQHAITEAGRRRRAHANPLTPGSSRLL